MNWQYRRRSFDLSVWFVAAWSYICVKPSYFNHKFTFLNTVQVKLSFFPHNSFKLKVYRETLEDESAKHWKMKALNIGRWKCYQLSSKAYSSLLQVLLGWINSIIKRKHHDQLIMVFLCALKNFIGLAS